MQSLYHATTAVATPERCARQMVETVPVVMQFMRRQMRRARHDLAIPQLRTLYFISLHEKTSLSDVADYVGLSLPAMSRLVDALVRKSLVSRKACEKDRRHVRLRITPAGQTAVDVAWKAAQDRLTEEISSMTAGQREAISVSMEILRTRFDPETVKD